MFKKYRMYRYIQRHGKATEDDLKKRFGVSDGYLSELTNLGTNIDCELDWTRGDEPGKAIYKLKERGIEYVASVQRTIFLCILGAVLAAAFTRLSESAPMIIEFMRQVLQ